MKIVFIGLSISSSWGNGHATTYRGLLKELGMMGHEVFFLERDKPWYSNNRDLGNPQEYRLELYTSVEELRAKFEGLVQTAHLVIVGSYVPQGVEVAEWVLQTASGITAFYDIDTPVTLDKLDKGDEEYLSKRIIPEFDLYLSFSGGELLQLLEKKYRAKNAKALYCSVDPGMFYPMELEKEYGLGYLGTYSDDRQPTIQNLLIRPANLLRKEKFAVAGPGYPEEIHWPENVQRIDHLPPDLHRDFYNRQKFTMNVTRQAMIKLGFSPSVRLFEAAACAVPIISDDWKGLTDLFEEGKEIFIARSTEDMVFILKNTPEQQRIKVGEAARKKIMNSHTAAHRALELITYYQEVKHLIKRKAS